MYGYGFSMVFNSIATAVRAAGEIFNRLTEDGVNIKAVADALFNRLTEDGMNRTTEDNQQRIIE